MVGTNNASESISPSPKEISTSGAKNLNTLFRSICNSKMDKNKRMLCAPRKRHRASSTIENTVKLGKSYLDSALERLDSLQFKIEFIVKKSTVKFIT